MAIVPQIHILTTDLLTEDPPIFAAMVPDKARNRMENPYWKKIICFKGPKTANNRGNIPPTRKEAADATAACKGFAREISLIPNTPETELNELSAIYENRGLTSELAKEVAKQLTAHNALEAHARDELGLNEISRAKPLQAALASAASFIAGGILPLLISIFAPLSQMIYFQYGFSIVFLALSGTIAAKVGGSVITKSVLRICIWGTIAMVMSALIGYLFGVSIN